MTLLSTVFSCTTSPLCNKPLLGLICLFCFVCFFVWFLNSKQIIKHTRSNGHKNLNWLHYLLRLEKTNTSSTYGRLLLWVSRYIMWYLTTLSSWSPVDPQLSPMGWANGKIHVLGFENSNSCQNQSSFWLDRCGNMTNIKMGWNIPIATCQWYNGIPIFGKSRMGTALRTSYYIKWTRHFTYTIPHTVEV